MNVKDTWKITRSHVKAAEKLNGPISENDGYINWPLYIFIEFKKTLIYPLHKCLRITDKIFEKLISLFESYKGKSFDLINLPLLKRFNDMIETECGISSPLYLSINESQVKFRSLNQNERLKNFTHRW